MNDRERINKSYKILREISYNKFIYQLDEVKLPIKQFNEVLDILDINHEYELGTTTKDTA